MGRSTFLFFPLGKTIPGLDDNGAEINSHLEGRVAETLCEDGPTYNNTLAGRSGGKNIWLCLRNSSGSALNCAGKGIRFSSGYWGRRAAGLVNAIGGYGLLADESLKQSVPVGAFFWVLKSGVIKAVYGGTVAVNDELCFDATGRLVKLDLTSGTSEEIHNKARRSRMFALEAGVVGDSKKVAVWDY